MHLSCPNCQSQFMSIAATAGRCPRCGSYIPPAQGTVTGRRIAPVPTNVTLEPVPSQVRSIPVAALLAVALVLVVLTIGSGAVAMLVLSRGQDNAQAKVAQAKVDPDDHQTVDPDLAVIKPTKVTEKPELKTTVVKRTPKRELILPGNAGEFEIGFMTSMAKGRRFVIIADRSGSMGQGLMGEIFRLQGKRLRRPIDVLHDELEKTIRSIKRGGKYHIIYYSNSAMPMPYGNPWMEGEKDIDRVVNWVRSIGPSGGTRPFPAFRIAFDLDPLPDVIFFMTDGQFPHTVADQVKFLNDRHGGKVKINTIQFSPPRSRFNGSQLVRNRTLERIAVDSGGKYTLFTGSNQP